jgi:hypothetical protein
VKFGHVLGMLHEHQNPAGGEVALKIVNTTIQFYGVKEDWEPETVGKQVYDADSILKRLSLTK